MSTILDNLKLLYREIKGRKQPPQVTRPSSMDGLFRFRYAQFKELLTANSELLNTLAEISEKLQGESVFGKTLIRNQVNKALKNAFQMAKCLSVMSGGKYRELYGVIERVQWRIEEILAESKSDRIIPPVMLYRDITCGDADWVGGKNANLGEVFNHLNIPIPRGFAITTKAFHLLLDANDIKEEIIKLRNVVYTDQVEQLSDISSHAHDLIKGSTLPAELVDSFQAACDGIWGDNPSVLLAMRSSAVGEDGDISFAGQYLTLLGLKRPELNDAYKEIVASLYSARSIAYRNAKGMHEEDLAMGVACLEMVNSMASGVMYTRHPYDITNHNLLINAVWGLGPYAVDGMITPDTYTVGKEPPYTIIKKSIANKPIQLRLKMDGGVEERPVVAADQDAPCLGDDQISELARYGALLENHYKCPQDIEWALRPDGKLLLLQTRPLKLQTPQDYCLLQAPPLPGHEVLLEKCEIAAQGVGSGPVHIVDNFEDLTTFPSGGVLVARHSSPEYVVVMKHCSAIIVEAGSVSGHMAAVAREFDVPTLITNRSLEGVLGAGRHVTVDAHCGRVYDGVVDELIGAVQKDQAYMKGTPVYEQLQRIAKHIIPLNLVNPAAPEFSPSGCQTLHDLARFCHEISYQEMFQISDLASKYHGWSLKLNVSLPIDIHLIDLGNGLKEDYNIKWNSVTGEQLASVPFKALIGGMLSINDREPRPINLSGFFSVMKEQTTSPSRQGERFGDRSYAIIADKYLNFSSRVGYHYSVIDAYCGETINKNYITFTFKGGAADEVRRNRRVRAISLILDREEFKVTVRGDKVDAQLKKYPRQSIETKLEMLGRLLIFTRQLDMLMTSDDSIEWVADCFKIGNYKLDK